MRIAIIVNSVRKGDGGNTTFSLANRLARSGHEVWVATPSRFALDPAGRLSLFARNAGEGRFRSSQRFYDALRAEGAREEWIDVRELDALLLRFNPFVLEAWALTGALDFARLAAEEGVVVLNDPDGLSRATSKLYLEGFPEEIRPRSLVSRNRARIERFIEEEGRVVLKPLRGYGGKSVFLVTRDDRANFRKFLSTAARDGFVVAQEYLPAAEKGDTRLFLLDGEPIVQEKQVAVVQRVGAEGDIRSNVHAGGEARPAEMTDALHRIAQVVRPKLLADGMFFVALDVAGDKVLEINVFSPGGLQAVRELSSVDFTRSIALAVERRVEARAVRDERRA